MKIARFFNLRVSDYQMDCKLCSVSCIKAGKQSNGKQKYFCKACKKYQQSEYCYVASGMNRVQNIFIALHNEGNGIRGIARILGISCNTVMKWKQKIACQIKKPIDFANKHTYEIDEMYCYVGRKQNPVWIMYVYDRTARRVIDFKVGARTKENMRQLIDQVLVKNPKQIGTDGLVFYKSLIPSKIHKVGLNYTRHIERFNLNLRIHLKCLARKTICFAKNIHMLEASLKLYFWGSNDLLKSVS